MIDLNLKTKTNQEKEDPMGLIILALLPFAVGFWLMLATAL